MPAIGARVKLCTAIGAYPAGTEAVVVSVHGQVCEVEIEVGRRYLIDLAALAYVEERASTELTGYPG